MAFYGLNFLFDNHYSENFGMYIKSINGGGVTNSSSGSNTTVFNDNVFRKPTKYFYGTSLNEVLSFEIEVLSPSPIYGYNRGKIEKWLFGKEKYCKLQIIQPDLQNIYFNCFLLNPQSIYVGNLCYGFRFTVECDAPFAWQNQKTYTFPNNTRNINQSLVHFNDSDYNGYTYPYIEVLIGDKGGDISITNTSDNSREVIIYNTMPNELITLDNNYHIIKSDKMEYISERFNKKFFRLIYGNNYINLTGDILSFKMKYSNARKVGG